MHHFKVTQFGRKHSKTIFLLGGWTYRPWLLWPVGLLLAARGYHCLAYTYDDAVFSPDYKKTVRDVIAVKDDILQRISLLKQNGCSDFYIFGTSLGTVIATLAANQSPDISKVILNTAGADTARTVWSWDSVNPSFKKRLIDQGLTLPKLMHEWRPISAGYHLDNLASKEVLVYLAKNDVTIPYTEGEALMRALDAHGVDYQLDIDARRSHVKAGLYNLWHAKRYLDFLDSSKG